MEAPQAKKIEKILEIHGDKRIDNYFWHQISGRRKCLCRFHHERYRTASGKPFRRNEGAI
jgi:protease II